MPKLSIVTVNRNNALGLKRTIKSVLDQFFSDYEYIIIDGASTDGSNDIIKEFSSAINYWISEPDKGIYNAMNKGINKATGDFCLFLNSGDYLINCDVLNNVFIKNFNEDLIIGSIVLDGDKQKLFEIPDIDKLTFRFFINSTLPHPGTFIKRELFNKLGLFNEGNVISSDLEFFLNAIFKGGATLRKIPETISVFDCNGQSSLPENTALLIEERSGILKNHFPRILPDYLYLEQLELKNIELENKIKHSFWILTTKILKKIINR